MSQPEILFFFQIQNEAITLSREAKVACSGGQRCPSRNFHVKPAKACGVLKDTKKDVDDGGRRCGARVGHLRHSGALVLEDFMAVDSIWTAIYAHLSERLMWTTSDSTQPPLTPPTVPDQSTALKVSQAGFEPFLLVVCLCCSLISTLTVSFFVMVGGVRARQLLLLLHRLLRQRVTARERRSQGHAQTWFDGHHLRQPDVVASSHKRRFIHNLAAVLGHHGVEEVVLMGDLAALKQVFGQVRKSDVTQEGRQHGDRLEGKLLDHNLLHLSSGVVHPQLSGPAGVVDERRQPQVRFSSTDTQYQAEQVGGHGAVGVGPFDEEHAEQLREDDDVNQV